MASPRRKRRIALTLAVLLLTPLIFVPALPRARVRLQVGWLGYRLTSSDPEVRDAAALRLLAIGRPAIDEVYPKLVATYVAAMAADPAVVVLTGKVIQRDRSTGNHDLEPETLLKENNVHLRSGPGIFIGITTPPETPVGKALTRRDARRELLVFRDGRAVHSFSDLGGSVWHSAGNPDWEIRVAFAIPLDDDLTPAVLTAVKEALSTGVRSP